MTFRPDLKDMNDSDLIPNDVPPERWAWEASIAIEEVLKLRKVEFFEKELLEVAAAILRRIGN